MKKGCRRRISFGGFTDDPFFFGGLLLLSYGDLRSFLEKYFTCLLKKDIILKDLFRSEKTWPVPVIPEEKENHPGIL